MDQTSSMLRGNVSPEVPPPRQPRPAAQKPRPHIKAEPEVHFSRRKPSSILSLQNLSGRKPEKKKSAKVLFPKKESSLALFGKKGSSWNIFGKSKSSRNIFGKKRSSRDIFGKTKSSVSLYAPPKSSQKTILFGENSNSRQALTQKKSEEFQQQKSVCVATNKFYIMQKKQRNFR